jgi:hypothetical protein
MSIASAFVLGLAACGGGTRDVTKDVAKRGANGARSTPSEQTVAPSAVEASAAGTSAAAKPPDEGPIMEGDHSIIRTEAVGPLHVGEWRRPVMSFVYAITARAGRDSEGIIVVRGIGKDTLSLTFQNDTLRRVFITHTGPHTTGGLAVGTPFATVAGDSGVTIAKRGNAKVATLSRLCGVEFATDSIALSPDSIVRKPARQPETIQAISVGYCKR